MPFKSRSRIRVQERASERARDVLLFVRSRSRKCVGLDSKFKGAGAAEGFTQSQKIVGGGFEQFGLEEVVNRYCYCYVTVIRVYRFARKHLGLGLRGIPSLPCCKEDEVVSHHS